MFSLRRLSAGLTVLACAALGVVGLGQAPASAAPNFQVPFNCGVTVTAATFSGHNPSASVDFQKSGITGMPVLASSGGTVSRVDNEGSTSYGRWVEIDHGAGWRTRYAHLSTQDVRVGQRVGTGTQIGRAGATGGVTGPHLHYEQILNGNAVKIVLNGVKVPYYGHTPFTSRNNCGGNPHSPESACGAGYGVIDRARLGDQGTVFLLYHGGTKRNCVVTMKAKQVGKRTPTSAFLEVKGAKRATDRGDFAYYAGPIRAAAGGTCVRWGGSLGSHRYASPFEHCG